MKRSLLNDQPLIGMKQKMCSKISPQVVSSKYQKLLNEKQKKPTSQVKLKVHKKIQLKNPTKRSSISISIQNYSQLKNSTIIKSINLSKKQTNIHTDKNQFKQNLFNNSRSNIKSTYLIKDQRDYLIKTHDEENQEHQQNYTNQYLSRQQQNQKNSHQHQKNSHQHSNNYSHLNIHSNNHSHSHTKNRQYSNNNNVIEQQFFTNSKLQSSTCVFYPQSANKRVSNSIKKKTYSPHKFNQQFTFSFQKDQYISKQISPLNLQPFQNVQLVSPLIMSFQKFQDDKKSIDNLNKKQNYHNQHNQLNQHNQHNEYKTKTKKMKVQLKNAVQTMKNSAQKFQTYQNKQNIPDKSKRQRVLSYSDYIKIINPHNLAQSVIKEKDYQNEKDNKYFSKKQNISQNNFINQFNQVQKNSTKGLSKQKNGQKINSKKLYNKNDQVLSLIRNQSGISKLTTQKSQNTKKNESKIKKSQRLKKSELKQQKTRLKYQLNQKNVQKTQVKRAQSKNRGLNLNQLQKTHTSKQSNLYRNNSAINNIQTNKINSYSNQYKRNLDKHNVDKNNLYKQHLDKNNLYKRNLDKHNLDKYNPLQQFQESYEEDIDNLHLVTLDSNQNRYHNQFFIDQSDQDYKYHKSINTNDNFNHSTHIDNKMNNPSNHINNITNINNHNHNHNHNNSNNRNNKLNNHNHSNNHNHNHNKLNHKHHNTKLNYNHRSNENYNNRSNENHDTNENSKDNINSVPTRQRKISLKKLKQSYISQHDNYNYNTFYNDVKSVQSQSGQISFNQLENTNQHVFLYQQSNNKNNSLLIKQQMNKIQRKTAQILNCYQQSLKQARQQIERLKQKLSRKKHKPFNSLSKQIKT